MENKALVKKAEQYVFALFKEKLPQGFVYHNFRHVSEVANAAVKIAQKSNFSDWEIDVIALAAWFHDSGLTVNEATHEAESCIIATEFLKSENYYPERIQAVCQCIMATKMPQAPQNKLQEVLCDADLSSLAGENFDESHELLRMEWGILRGKYFSDLEWLRSEVDFLIKHTYFTQYGQTVLQEEKNKNLVKLQKKVRKLETEELEEELKKEEKGKGKKKGKDKEKDEEENSKFVRGIDMMFKVTSQNHVQLSAMADNKANIMISINAIIISISVTGMVPKFDNNHFIIIPTVMLLAVCLATIIFATLSTRPKITSGKFTDDDIKNRKVNLLFFGNFYSMSYEEYHAAVTEMINDRKFLYGSLIKDIYFLGLVLARKYRLLRTSYSIFMYGLISSVIVYVIAFLMWKMKNP